MIQHQPADSVLDLLRRIQDECGTDMPDSERIRRWASEAKSGYQNNLARARREGAEEERDLAAAVCHYKAAFYDGTKVGRRLGASGCAKECAEQIERGDYPDGVRRFIPTPPPAAPAQPAEGEMEAFDRVVLVDHAEEMLGRVYDKRGVSVEIQRQDGGRTLKVFVQARAGRGSA